jgi:hypothetical protein
VRAVQNGAVVDRHDAVFRFNAMRHEADALYTGTKTTFRLFNRKRQVCVPSRPADICGVPPDACRWAPGNNFLSGLSEKTFKSAFLCRRCVASCSPGLGLGSGSRLGLGLARFPICSFSASLSQAHDPPRMASRHTEWVGPAQLTLFRNDFKPVASEPGGAPEYWIFWNYMGIPQLAATKSRLNEHTHLMHPELIRCAPGVTLTLGKKTQLATQWGVTLTLGKAQWGRKHSLRRHSGARERTLQLRRRLKELHHTVSDNQQLLVARSTPSNTHGQQSACSQGRSTALSRSDTNLFDILPPQWAY